MRQILFLILAMATGLNAIPQYKVSVEDIPRFWAAFDLVIATTDSSEQVKIIQEQYLNKGTIGLKEFNAVRDGTAVNYRNYILKSKDNLERKKPYTLSALNQKPILDTKLAYFKELYPGFKPGDVYFTIGIGNSGGTVEGSHVLIGAEVAAGPSPDWAVGLTLHEFVHTQQKQDTNYYFLSQCLMEGAAEFIMEQVNQKSIREVSPRGYISFGLMNEKETWDKFKPVMFATEQDGLGWLYGGGGVEIAGIPKVDMGYYMGYRICKSYFDKAVDKKNAIRDIIDLPYAREAARNFVLSSGYVPKSDEEYVKTTPYAPMKKSTNTVAQTNYGVTQKKEFVLFSYQAPQALVGKYIDSVFLAGSFNNWQGSNAAYKMTPGKDALFTYSMPVSALRKGETYTFKFVVNGSDWLPGGDQNLQFTVQ